MLAQQRLHALLFACVLLLGLVVFWPALTGPFFFDDMVHLPKLAGRDGQIDTAAEVFRLILPDHQGSGRSLSYLSLLINDNSWPTTPWAFKYTNLLLHLLNGVLVFVLARTLGRLIAKGERSESACDRAALIAMALWLIHPLQLSPTMMVIQRMALLGATFSLLALIAFLHGRRIAAERPVRGYLWLVLGFGTAILLGILSKETALMTVCFVIAMEATVLSRENPMRPPYWNLWAGVFLVLPLLLTAAYLLSIVPDMGEAYLNRNFDAKERLLTEARVLMEYLRTILLPSLTGSGPFRDDFEVSRSLLEPITTLIALLTIALLVAAALLRRRRNPLFALAVLWFFLGHTLEGSALPLELYFEHRNYLPMLGIWFAIGYFLATRSGTTLRLGLATLAAFIALEAGITFSSARVWGSHAAIAALWPTERPASARAQIKAFHYWAAQGDGERLRAQLEHAIAHRPDYAAHHLHRFLVDRCRAPHRPSLGGSLEDLERVVPIAPFEPASLESLDWLSTDGQQERCQITYEEARHIFDLYLTSANYTRVDLPRASLYMSLAKLHKANGKLDLTISAMDRAYEALPSFEIALNQAFYLATAGLFDDAEVYVRRAASAPPIFTFQRVRRDEEVQAFNHALEQMRKDAKQQELVPAGASSR